MKGKQRCKILKEIRQKIADANDIAFITSECQHKGDCLGTCPKCEAELRYLERELEKRQRLGKTVAVAGLTAIIATSTVGCDDWFGNKELGGEPLPPDNYEYELDGDVALPPDTSGDLLPPEEPELAGVMPLPPEETVLKDIDSDLSAEELTAILTCGVTREGLYNSESWSERLVRRDENSDTYLCPIDTFDLVTVYCDEQGYVVEVEYADTMPDESDPIVMPEDDLT